MFMYCMSVCERDVVKVLRCLCVVLCLLMVDVVLDVAECCEDVRGRCSLLDVEMMFVLFESAC